MNSREVAGVELDRLEDPRLEELATRGESLLFAEAFVVVTEFDRLLLTVA